MLRMRTMFVGRFSGLSKVGFKIWERFPVMRILPASVTALTILGGWSGHRRIQRPNGTPPYGGRASHRSISAICRASPKALPPLSITTAKWWEKLADWSITKHGRQITGTSMTFNPDLVISAGHAVADVKYKLTASEWRRADLYQLVAFAAAFHAQRAALIGFVEPGRDQPPRIRVGTMDLAHLDWPADPTIAPKHAASAFCASTRSWLDEGAIRSGTAAWAS